MINFVRGNERRWDLFFSCVFAGKKKKKKKLKVLLCMIPKSCWKLHHLLLCFSFLFFLQSRSSGGELQCCVVCVCVCCMCCSKFS